MTARTRLLASAAIGLATIATIASPRAATITEASVPIRADPYTGRAELTLPAFDGALGAITSLSITVSAVLTESMILATLSGGPIPSTGAFSIHTSLWFAPGPDGDIRIDPWTVSAPIGQDGRGNPQALITAGFTGAFELPMPGPDPGPGPVVFYDLYASPIDLYSPGDGLHNISMAGSATATYTYVPVPVPESSTMTLVLSFLGIGLIAWTLSAGPRRGRGMFQ